MTKIQFYSINKSEWNCFPDMANFTRQVSILSALKIQKQWYMRIKKILSVDFSSLVCLLLTRQAGDDSSRNE